MSIIITEITSGRSFTVNEKNERTYTRTFQAHTDSDSIGQLSVANAVSATIGPYYDTGNETDILAKTKSIKADQTSEDGRSWRVVVEYGMLENNAPDTNPLNEPIQINWSFAQFTRSIVKDINGTAILNSAFDPFLDPIEVDDSRPVLTITRNEANFNASLAYEYRDAVNSDTFQGVAPGQVKVAAISSTRQYDQTYGFYWQTSYTFHFSVDGFDAIVLDQGVREIKNDKRVNITISGNPIAEPVLLNGEGQQLPHDDPPVFKIFQVYKRLPFAIFNL